jgi:O-acetyl-ADP-ribose deacetylase (regulator of RNase III)
MKCVKKYKDGGAAWPPGKRNRGGGGGVDYGSGAGRGHRLSRECKEADEQKRGQKVEHKGGMSGAVKPKAPDRKINRVALQPPKTGIPEYTKEQKELGKQRRHSNPRFL